uniref:Flavin-dependent oxidoreductase FOX3-like n=1 Tax=Nicotiana tabacum TaxID=4097 RepID=A0A1S4ALE5_TOBAC|nr:PREDICTED: flavin-dependent oxidoreductase FOX3-like [Nicotiana tabacum]
MVYKVPALPDLEYEQQGYGYLPRPEKWQACPRSRRCSPVVAPDHERVPTVAAPDHEHVPSVAAPDREHVPRSLPPVVAPGRERVPPVAAPDRERMKETRYRHQENSSIDLSNLRRIDIDVQGKTAWVEAGATLGELYYNIANKSKTLALPAETFPSVGVGGHISGGGQRPLMRKYGLAADNVLDATILNVNGTILDRSGMGEYLFWVIRGGGAASFGVVLSWKLQLVEIPPVVTFFTIARTQEKGATNLVRKWQKLVIEFPKELFLRININP